MAGMAIWNVGANRRHCERCNYARSAAELSVLLACAHEGQAGVGFLPVNMTVRGRAGRRAESPVRRG